MPQITIGELLRRHRKEADLTQKAVADLIGYDNSLVSRIENGRATPTQEYISLFINKLNLSEDDSKEIRTSLTDKLYDKLKEPPDPLEEPVNNQTSYIDTLFRKATDAHFVSGDLGAALELYRDIEDLDPSYPRINLLIREAEFEYNKDYVNPRGQVVPDLVPRQAVLFSKRIDQNIVVIPEIALDQNLDVLIENIEKNRLLQLGRKIVVGFTIIIAIILMVRMLLLPDNSQQIPEDTPILPDIPEFTIEPSNIDLIEVKIDEFGQVWDVQKGTILEKDNLDRVDLRGENLKRVDLIEANLSRANLSGADIKWNDLIEANLIGANLREADLREADLREADLDLADLSGADLSGANLREADLIRADLREANLKRVDLIGANLSWGKSKWGKSNWGRPK